MRDLFESDDGGWLQDVPLLDRLVAEKLAHDAALIRAEGWKWVEVAIDFPYGHTYGLRTLQGDRQPLSEEQVTTYEALRSEADQLEAQYDDADDIPEEVDARLAEIEAALEALDDRPVVYASADIARGGAFVSLDGTGKLRIERGYVRPVDETSVDAADDNEGEGPSANDSNSTDEAVGVDASIDEEDEGLRPLPDKLLTELTAYRTLALREALGSDPDVAFLAALHALCLRLFYQYGSDSCLEIQANSVAFGAQAPGLSDMPLAARVDARHLDWSQQLPAEPRDLWDALLIFTPEARHQLFAHCVSLTVNAVHEVWSRRPQAIANADRLASTLSLDIAATGWTPTADNFFGRVTKARIVGAVREAKGLDAARRIETLKKGDMAKEAEKHLIGTNWLPEPLRTPGRASPAPDMTSDDLAAAEIEPIEETETFESETAMDEAAPEEEADQAPDTDSFGVAAE